MGKKNLAPTAENVLASKQLQGVSPRGVLRGKLRPKGGGVGGVDPSVGTATRRTNVEYMGARRRIDVNLPGPESPEAHSVQANGRIIRGYKDARTNFYEGGAS